MTESTQQDEDFQLTLAQTLLRIVAQLQKTEYSESKSNGHYRQRQADELELDDLPNPASDTSTAQG